ALRGRPRADAALPASGAAPQRRDAARRDRVLRHPSVAGHAAAAVVLGRGDRLLGPAGQRRLAARRRAVDDRARLHGDGAGGLRPLLLLGLEQGPGGPQGPLHAHARPRLPRPRPPAPYARPQPAAEGPEGLPPRYHAVVAASPPSRP